MHQEYQLSRNLNVFDFPSFSIHSVFIKHSGVQGLIIWQLSFFFRGKGWGGGGGCGESWCIKPPLPPLEFQFLHILRPQNFHQLLVLDKK